MRQFGLVLGLIILSGCSASPDFKQMSFSGTLELTEHILGIKTAGRLTTLSVEEGDRVKKGQLLASFDRFEQNKKDFERLMVLYSNGGTNHQSLENAQLAMEDQEVIAPVDGIVLVKSAEIGEIIPAGAGVVVIGDTNDQWVKIYVTEDLMHQLRIGQQASISLDGTNKVYHGHVSFLADKAEFTPRNVQTPEERITQTFAVKVKVDDADDNLHPGVAADVRFQ